jgi:hypothetical protein
MKESGDPITGSVNFSHQDREGLPAKVQIGKTLSTRKKTPALQRRGYKHPGQPRGQMLGTERLCRGAVAKAVAFNLHVKCRKCPHGNLGGVWSIIQNDSCVKWRWRAPERRVVVDRCLAPVTINDPNSTEQFWNSCTNTRNATE